MDVTKERRSGKVCMTHRGHEIIWRGHLCEGANLTPKRYDNFCLWTRCGKHDVPADKGYEGDIKEVTCPECRSIWNDENGPFGVGA